MQQQSKRSSKAPRQAEAMVEAGEYLTWCIARVYVALDENKEALVWLQKGFEDYAGGMERLRVEPDFDPLRSDPRFRELLRRMNFLPWDADSNIPVLKEAKAEYPKLQ